jgi:putative transposase
MEETSSADRQKIGRWAGNRAENSHQLFRQRKRAMLKFRNIKTPQKFSFVHAAVHNQFNQDRRLIYRHNYNIRRSAARAEWRSLTA